MFTGIIEAVGTVRSVTRGKPASRWWWPIRGPMFSWARALR